MAVCYCFFVLVVFTFIVDSDNLAVLFVYLLIVPVFIWSLGEFGCFDIFMFFQYIWSSGNLAVCCFKVFFIYFEFG